MPEPNASLVDRLLGLALKQIDTYALLLLDPDGIVLAWLAGASRVFGYSAEEMIGRSCDVLFTPEDAARGIPKWERETAARAGEAEDDRWQLRKDGARIWASGAMTPLFDDAGQLLGFAKILRVRTDQKTQMEALESRIDSLQQSEQRRMNFTSTLAHEVRSPLSAISSAAALLEQRTDGSPDIRFAVGTVRRQVDFMSRMISDLTDLARAALGKTRLQTERVALQSIITHASEACAASIRQRRHRLSHLMPEVPIYLDADPMRLRQVLINLLENAAKYTPPGGKIWVKLTTEGEDAVIKVSDNGIGIAPDVMPHIFELFTQADEAEARQTGLGIGLAVVKDAVALHGGTVQAQSDGVNKGAEFTVRLPLQGSQPGP